MRRIATVALLGLAACRPAALAERRTVLELPSEDVPGVHRAPQTAQVWLYEVDVPRGVRTSPALE